MSADTNLVVLSGRLATPPEVRRFDSGAELLRLTVTVRVDSPRRRVDVVPVTYWGDLEGGRIDPDLLEVFETAPAGTRVMISGSVQRRFWESPDGRRSRLEVVAEDLTVKADETAAVAS